MTTVGSQANSSSTNASVLNNAKNCFSDTDYLKNIENCVFDIKKKFVNSDSKLLPKITILFNVSFNMASFVNPVFSMISPAIEFLSSMYTILKANSKAINNTKSVKDKLSEVLAYKVEGKTNEEEVNNILEKNRTIVERELKNIEISNESDENGNKIKKPLLESLGKVVILSGLAAVNYSMSLKLIIRVASMVLVAVAYTLLEKSKNRKISKLDLNDKLNSGIKNIGYAKSVNDSLNAEINDKIWEGDKEAVTGMKFQILNKLLNTKVGRSGTFKDLISAYKQEKSDKDKKKIKKQIIKEQKAFISKLDETLDEEFSISGTLEAQRLVNSIKRFIKGCINLEVNANEGLPEVNSEIIGRADKFNIIYRENGAEKLFNKAIESFKNNVSEAIKECFQEGTVKNVYFVDINKQNITLNKLAELSKEDSSYNMLMLNGKEVLNIPVGEEAKYSVSNIEESISKEFSEKVQELLNDGKKFNDIIDYINNEYSLEVAKRVLPVIEFDDSKEEFKELKNNISTGIKANVSNDDNIVHVVEDKVENDQNGKKGKGSKRSVSIVNVIRASLNALLPPHIKKQEVEQSKQIKQSKQSKQREQSKQRNNNENVSLKEGFSLEDFKYANLGSIKLKLSKFFESFVEDAHQDDTKEVTESLDNISENADKAVLNDVKGIFKKYIRI